MISLAKLRIGELVHSLSGVRIPVSPPEKAKMATPAGGHFCLFGRSDGDSKGWAYRPSPLRIAHLPPLRGGAPKA